MNLNRRLILLVSIFFLIAPVSASIERGSSWDRVCDASVCTQIVYSIPMNMENATGQFEPFENVTTLVWENNKFVLTWWNGTKEIEPFFTINGINYTYDNLLKIFPNIKLEVNITKQRGAWKFGINILDIPTKEMVKPLENIGFRVLEGQVQQISPVNLKDEELQVKDNIKISFMDVQVTNTVEKYDDRTILIYNVSDIENIFLDPTITLQGAGDILEDVFVDQDDPGKDFQIWGAGTLEQGESSGGEGNATWSLIKFDISSLPNFVTVTDAILELFIYSNGYDTGETATSWVYELNNHTWQEGVTWYSRPTGAGALIYTNDSFDGDADDFWISYNVTTWVKSEYENDDLNASFLLNATLGYSAGDYLQACSSESSSGTPVGCLGTSTTPKLTITYEPYGPTFNSNQTFPLSPTFLDSVVVRTNVTDKDNDLVWVNFTVKFPNGTEVIDNVNGTLFDADFWNSTSFNSRAGGSWTINISASDDDSNVETIEWSFYVYNYAPSINSNYTTPSSPVFQGLTTVTANVTDLESDLTWVNFTVTGCSSGCPNNANGTVFDGDLWNSSTFQCDPAGTYTINITAGDSEGNVSTIEWSFTVFEGGGGTPSGGPGPVSESSCLPGDLLVYPKNTLPFTYSSVAVTEIYNFKGDNVTFDAMLSENLLSYCWTENQTTIAGSGTKGTLLVVCENMPSSGVVIGNWTVAGGGCEAIRQVCVGAQCGLPLSQMFAFFALLFINLPGSIVGLVLPPHNFNGFWNTFSQIINRTIRPDWGSFLGWMALFVFVVGIYALIQKQRNPKTFDRQFWTNRIMYGTIFLVLMFGALAFGWFFVETMFT